MTNQYLPTNINSPRNPRETDANLTLNLDDEFVIITANAPQITLPTAVQIPSREIYIKSVPGAGTVVGILGQTIDGSASFTFTTTNEVLLVKSNGANWFIVGGDTGGSMEPPLTTVTSGITTSTATLGSFDVYRMTAAGTTLTISSANITEGRVFIIRAIDASVGTPVTIDTEGAETIDGGASIVLTTPFDTVTLQATGGNLESIE